MRDLKTTTDTINEITMSIIVGINNELRDEFTTSDDCNSTEADD